MSESRINNNGKELLGFSDLWALGIGQVIGAGVITLVGPAIGLTGSSVWLAYLVAIILGAITNLPIIIFSSVTKYEGGGYSIITMLAGEKVGGMFIIGLSLSMLSMSLYITSLGMYIESLYSSINGIVVGIILLALFYIVNLLGMAKMAKFQKIMSSILIGSLLMFIIVGATKADFGQSLNFGSSDFYLNGASGFWAAVFMLIYSCQGYKLMINYGGQTKNSTKNLPLAMLAVIPVLMVVYTGISLVDASVLPLSEVAGKPLTLVAKTILPKTLFYAFIFGGPIMALLTTINSTYGSMIGPLTKAAKDGWIPGGIAKRNKFGGATVILTIQFVVALIPILMRFSIGQIVSNIMLLISFYNFLQFYALFQVPKKMPKKWAKATMHINDGVYYLILVVAVIIQAIIFYNSIKNITVENAVFVISLMLICFVYAVVRHNSGKTHVDTEGMLDLE